MVLSMRLGSVFVVALSTALGTTANAAQITDVADAADRVKVGSYERDDPFDFNFRATFSQQIDSGKITREPFERVGISSDCTADSPADCVPVDELDYTRKLSTLRLAAEFGLYHDLSLTLGWTYVTSNSLKFKFADGVSPENSSIAPTNGTQLFAADFESSQSGSGPLDLTLRWAPLSELRDSTKPTWVLYFSWSSPWTTSVVDPSKFSAAGDYDGKAPVGDGVHRLTFGTSFSKRLGGLQYDIDIDPDANRRGLFDPYLDVSYTLPIPEDGLALVDLINNRDNPFGEDPSHEGRVRAGVEIVPVEDLLNQRKFAIDLGFMTTLYTDGRNYSLLANPLRELTFEEQHARIEGFLNFYVQAAEFVQFHGGISVGHVTEHFLTFEDVGEDRDGDGQVLPNTDDGLNPYFCGNDPDDICSVSNVPSVDQVGFRFKDEEHFTFSWFISALLTF